MAKSKTPAYKKPSPNNPRNNSGISIRKSAKGPTPKSLYVDDYLTDGRWEESNVNKAGDRARSRAKAQGAGYKKIDAKSMEAEKGMARKNLQAKHKARLTPSAIKKTASVNNPASKKGVDAYTRYNTSKQTLPKKSPSMGKAVTSGAGKVLARANAAGIAFTAGHMAGTAIYNKNAVKIQDTLDKYVRNRKRK